MSTATVSKSVKGKLEKAYENHKTTVPCYSIRTKTQDIFAIQMPSGPNLSYYMISLDRERPKDRAVSMKTVRVDLAESIKTLPLKEIVTDVFLKKDARVPNYVTPLSCSEAIEHFGLDGGIPSLARDSAELFLHQLSDDSLVRKMDLKTVMQLESRRFDGGGLSAFRELLDKKALNALKSAGAFTWADYAFYADTSEKGEIRRQAASIYPLMATVMARRVSIKRAIDAQESLNGVLQNAFGQGDNGKPLVSKGMLKRLQQVEIDHATLPPEKAIADLSQLPTDWVPSNEEDWAAFSTLSTSVGTILKDVTGSPLSTLYDGCGGKWQAFLERCAMAYRDTRPPQGTTEESMAYFKEAIDWRAFSKAKRPEVPELVEKTMAKIDVPDGIPAEEVSDWLHRLYAPSTAPGDIRNATQDIGEMASLLAYQVVLPMAISEAEPPELIFTDLHLRQAQEIAASMLFTGRSATNILEAGRKWHNSLPDLMAKMDEIDEQRNAHNNVMEGIAEDGWPALTDAIMAPNGLYLIPLTDPRALAQEGEDLRHCVGGYVGSCRDRGHHIISVRQVAADNSLRSLSTIELGPVRRGGEINVCQHRGERNQTPSPEALAAADWYVRSLSNGNIPINYDRVRSFLNVRHQTYDRVEILCGYDWKQRSYIKQAQQIWSPFLLKKYRKMDFDELSALPEVRSLVEELSPYTQFKFG